MVSKKNFELFSFVKIILICIFLVKHNVSAKPATINLIKFHLTYQVVNVRENGMRQSRIDNSEILAELGTQDTGRRQKKPHRQLKR